MCTVIPCKKKTKKNIQEMQYELNNLLSNSKDNAIDMKTLKMSQELDELIVKYYKDKNKDNENDNRVEKYGV